MLWSAIASAQFTPGQLLTAAELNSQFALYAPLAGAAYTGAVTTPTLTVSSTFSMPASTVLPSGVTATEQGYLDNSTLVATNNFVKRTLLASSATLPIQNVTGGTYNFASVGSGAQIVILASGGAITSVLTIAVPGSGYQVGDCLVMVGGNGDAILRVTSISGSGVATASVVYGGTGYTTGAQLTGMPLPPGTRTGNITGTLTSNATIVIPSGTLLQGARFIGFDNNTTGAFTVTVKLSNGSGGSTGAGVVLPQGSANFTSVTLYTDGVNDVWLADSPAGIGALSASAGAVPLTSLATQAANTVVGNGTGSTASPTALAVPSCSTSSSALNWTSASGFSCNTSVNAATLGGTAAASYALLASPTFTGTPAAPTAAATTNTTQIATTAMVNSAITGGSLAGSFTTLAASGLLTPSQTNGIAGITNGGAAAAGSVGQVISNTGTAVSLTTGVSTNITSVSLTAGDFWCSGNIEYDPAGTTIPQAVVSGINTTSATLPPAPFKSILADTGAVTLGTGTIVAIPVIATHENVSTTTTVYLVGNAQFSTSTMTATGRIDCLRVR